MDRILKNWKKLYQSDIKVKHSWLLSQFFTSFCAIIGDEINFFVHLNESIDDLIAIFNDIILTP